MREETAIGKVVRWLLIASLSLGMVFASGCFLVASSYEKMEPTVPPGDTLQVQFQVGDDEILEGHWTSQGGDIEGSYLRPDGRKSQWSSTSMQHDFELDGTRYPGLYVFKFVNSGSERGVVKFRYRTKPPAEEYQP